MVNDNACVELARLPDSIGVRDSKHPSSGHLALGKRAFKGLLREVKRRA
ncbi:hypothetical protein GCM10022221_37350 [Actinocorallia aurea]